MIECAPQNIPADEIFLNRVKEFEKKNPEESKQLAGNLLEWGAAAVPENQTLRQAITSQINYRVKRSCEAGNPTTAEKLVDGLFSLNSKGEITADIIMARLQLG